MNDKNIEILYICTAKYKEYSKYFLLSLHYLFPEMNKIVKILTDDTEYINNIIQENSENLNQNKISFLDIIKITDLPYPLINLGKFAYINDYIDDSADYVFYFDADTYFIEKPDTFWINLLNVINNDKIILSPVSPYILSFFDYLYAEEHRGNRIYDMELCKNRCNERKSSLLYDKLHIPDVTHVWITTSFIAGSMEKIKSFSKYVNEKIQEYMIGPSVDGINQYLIPRLFDETVVNKIVYDRLCGKIQKYDFFVKPYAVSLPEAQIEDFTFIIQKYSDSSGYKKHYKWER